MIMHPCTDLSARWISHTTSVCFRTSNGYSEKREKHHHLPPLHQPKIGAKTAVHTWSSWYDSRPYSARRREQAHEPSTPAVSHSGVWLNHPPNDLLMVRPATTARHHHGFIRHTAPNTTRAIEVTSKPVGSRLRAPRFNSFG